LAAKQAEADAVGDAALSGLPQFLITSDLAGDAAIGAPADCVFQASGALLLRGTLPFRRPGRLLWEPRPTLRGMPRRPQRLWNRWRQQRTLSETRQ
jgi:hypothetical protein